MHPADGSYAFVDRQVGGVINAAGDRARWVRLLRTQVPLTAGDEELLSMQHFASPTPVPGECHTGDLVFDLDAHASWLSLETARTEASMLVDHLCASTGMVPDQDVLVAFSGGSGFHVTVPRAVAGDLASPHFTAACKDLARQLRDGLGLITLDAPTAFHGRARDDPVARTRALAVWRNHLTSRAAHTPLGTPDDAALLATLAKNGIYSNRRLIRRLNSRRTSGAYKVPLARAELDLDVDTIRALARAPRPLPCPPGTTANPVIADALAARITAQETQETSRPGTTRRADGSDVPLPPHANAPVCITRLVARPAPAGALNEPLILLASYLRAAGFGEDTAIRYSQSWAVAGVAVVEKQRERAAHATTTVRAAYRGRYRFGRSFVRPFHLATDAECRACPLRVPCWQSPQST